MFKSIAAQTVAAVWMNSPKWLSNAFDRSAIVGWALDVIDVQELAKRRQAYRWLRFVQLPAARRPIS